MYIIELSYNLATLKTLFLSISTHKRNFMSFKQLKYLTINTYEVKIFIYALQNIY